MDTNSKFIPTVGAVIALALFGSAYTAMERVKENVAAPPALQPVAIAPVNLGNFAALQQPFQQPPRQEAPPAAKKKPAALAEVPPRTWQVPSKPLEGFEKNDYDVVDLAINENGTRVLSKSKREVNCLDLTTSRILQTFVP